MLSIFSQSLFLNNVLEYDEQSSHAGVIRQHYVFLLETIDTKSTGLLSHLYSKEVINNMEKDDIEAEQTSFRANEKLLSVLSRKSQQQFQLFLDTLDSSGHKHVRNIITGQPGLSMPTVDTYNLIEPLEGSCCFCY